MIKYNKYIRLTFCSLSECVLDSLPAWRLTEDLRLSNRGDFSSNLGHREQVGVGRPQLVDASWLRYQKPRQVSLKYRSWQLLVNLLCLVHSAEFQTISWWFKYWKHHRECSPTMMQKPQAGL